MALDEKMPKRPWSFGEFYDLCCARFPEHRTVQRIFDVPRFASDLGITNETAYRMFRNNVVQPKLAAGLIEFSKREAKRLRRKSVRVKALTKADLIEYVIPDPD